MLTVVIGIHIAAGLTAVIAGLTAMLAPKQAGRHPHRGHVFLVAIGVVFATATGFTARRIRWHGWQRHHIAAMGIASIALPTTFYSTTGPNCRCGTCCRAAVSGSFPPQSAFHSSPARCSDTPHRQRPRSKDHT